MDKKVLLEILNTKYIEFTREEIRDIMNEELDKTPEEMDLGLVDLCLDALEGKFGYLKNEEPETNESQNKNLGKENPIELKRRISFKRFFIAAALVALIACVSMGVYADQRNNNVPEDVVAYGDDYYEVNLNGTTTTKPNDTVSYNELTEILKENGIDNPVLPQVFFEDGCELSDITVKNESDDIYVFGNVLVNDTIQASFTITKRESMVDLKQEEIMVSSKYKNINEYTINNVYVLLFANDNEYVIIYNNNYTQTKIILEKCEISSVERIINSIGNYQ